MQRRSLATFGIGATAGAAACALLTTGVVSGVVAGGSTTTKGVADTIDVLTRPPAAAAAEELPAFEDCESLRQWYVEAALPAVGPWGFGGGSWYGRGPVPAAGLDGRAARLDSVVETKAVGSSDTGTNVQEGGVDEPDIAKTDGRLVVRTVDDHLVTYDVSGDRARRLARIELPGPRWMDRELLLVGDRVLVVGTEAGRWGHWGPGAPGERSWTAWGQFHRWAATTPSRTWSRSTSRPPAPRSSRATSGSTATSWPHGSTATEPSAWWSAPATRSSTS